MSLTHHKRTLQACAARDPNPFIRSCAMDPRRMHDFRYDWKEEDAAPKSMYGGMVRQYEGDTDLWKKVRSSQGCRWQCMYTAVSCERIFDDAQKI